MPSNAQLDEGIIAVAKLIGLLDSTGNFQPDWFANPMAASALKGMPNRTADWIDAIQAAMGDPIPVPAVTGVTWLQAAQLFPIRNPLDGTPTGLHLVTPASGAASGTFGLGFLHTDRLENLDFTAFALAPLFTLSATADPTFDLDTKAVQVGLAVTRSDGKVFSAPGGVTFTGLTLDAGIFVHDTVPTCTLSFDGIANNGTTPKSYTALATLVADVATVAGWLSAILLEGSYWMHKYIGSTTCTVGDVLVAAEFLTDDPGSGYVLNQAYLTQNVANPKLLAENFLLNALKLLAASGDSGTPLIPIPIGDAGSGIFISAEPVPNNADHAVDYGLRLMIQDIVLGRQAATTSDPKPEFVVQLGQWIGKEDATDSWVTRCLDLTANQPQPGVSLYLLRNNKPAATTPDISFNPYVELVSVGFDVKGTPAHPILSVDGYVLGEAGLRVYLAQSSTDHTSFTFGAAVSLDEIGLPLGAGFGQGGQSSGGNPIAQQLLSAAPPASAGAPAKDPVNPTFSVSAAYIEGGSFSFQLYDAKGNPTDLVKLPVNRAFGPLQCQTLGLGWNSTTQQVSLLFDGGVSLASLSVDLIDLTVGIPVTHPTDIHRYSLDLQGLDVALQAGPVSVTGGLLKTGSGATVEYDGQAFLRFKNLAIGAIGSYTKLADGSASLFVFAFLSDPLGGPPACFVTGLAAGFGYNRALIAPPRDQVMSFPLVAGVSNPAAVGVTSGQAPDLDTVLTTLKASVPPTRGENWLAAGVQFTSFDIIHSNVLLIAEFGRTFEILILGLSTLKLPQTGKTYAYVELGLEVTIRPDLGEIGATAIITPNSYVIDPACHLTGGFAFYIWFGDNPHAGDFVLTVGGYNSAFTVPAWYPNVPRLGFNWALSGDVTIKGDAYFALTPSCVMAGGGLEILYSSGNLRAWCTAQADFLIAWKPYHYYVSIGVTIGVSYRIHFLFVDTTIRVEIGADVDVWGPPTGGQAHIHLWIVSFTVGFGADSSAVQTTVDWAGFKSMLPPSQPAAPAPAPPPHHGGPAAFAAIAPAPAPSSDSVPVVATIVANDGLLQTTTDHTWIVRPATFTFTVNSTVPATSATLTTAGTAVPPVSATYTLGIRPMGLSSVTSDLAVSITTDINTSWTCAPDQRDVPEAMWGAAIPAGSTPAPAAKVLPNYIVGLKEIATVPEPLTGPPEIVMAEAFAGVVIAAAPLPLSQSATPTGGLPSQDPSPPSLTDIAQITATSVAGNRTALFAALSQLGLDAGTNDSLAQMAADPPAVFADSPMVGSPLGS